MDVALASVYTGILPQETTKLEGIVKIFHSVFGIPLVLNDVASHSAKSARPSQEERSEIDLEIEEAEKHSKLNRQQGEGEGDWGQLSGEIDLHSLGILLDRLFRASCLFYVILRLYFRI